MDNLKNALYDSKIVNNCNGKNCSNCGECCTDFLPLTKREVKNIKAYIKKNNVQENIYVTEDTFDLRCPFYIKDSNKHCAIYPVRPDICRAFKCCQPIDFITDNKNSLSITADYNKFYKHSFHKTFVSLHNLFYNNHKYELEALYHMSNHDEKTFKKLLSDCLTNYLLEEKEVK